MKRLALILSFVAIWVGPCLAQSADIKTDVDGLVTVAARGTDVRPLLHDLFSQAKKSYVIEPGVRMVVYLSLSGVDFEEALQIICRNADLKYEIQNGIYYVSRANGPMNEDPKPDAPIKPKGKLPASALSIKVTTRFAKTDLGTVLASMGKQAGVKIELDPAAPHYKLDAYLIGAPLKQALDTLTKATGLQYVLTDEMSIWVTKPDPNKVMVVKSGS